MSVMGLGRPGRMLPDGIIRQYYEGSGANRVLVIEYWDKPTERIPMPDVVVPVAPTGSAAASAELQVTGEDLDAIQIIRDRLAQYGLESLSGVLESFLQKKEFRSADGRVSPTLVTAALRREPVYRARFAGKFALDDFIASERAAGRTPTVTSITEADQLALEKQYRATAVKYGLPANFYDTIEDFTKLITNGVSPDEFAARIMAAQEVTSVANPEVKQALRMRYGLNDSDITAFFLDPDVARERIGSKATTADLTRAANLAIVEGTGLVGGEAAQRVAETLAGPAQQLSAQNLIQGARGLEPLTRMSIEGEAAGLTGEEALLSLGEGQVTAQRAVTRERQRRLAEYQAGGQAAATAQGVVGLRSSNV